MNMCVACSRAAVATLSLAVGACGASETDSTDGVSAYFRFSDEATAADLGLPTYPGSKAYQDVDDSNSAANIGVSTSLFGFNVVALNLETSDNPQRIAAFYRQALSKYGNVLECNAATDADRNTSSDGLGCDSHKSGSHDVVYIVGTKQNQRIVAIKPYGNGTRFSLVHVNVRGAAKL